MNRWSSRLKSIESRIKKPVGLPVLFVGSKEEIAERSQDIGRHTVIFIDDIPED